MTTRNEKPAKTKEEEEEKKVVESEEEEVEIKEAEEEERESRKEETKKQTKRRRRMTSPPKPGIHRAVLLWVDEWSLVGNLRTLLSIVALVAFLVAVDEAMAPRISRRCLNHSAETELKGEPPSPASAAVCNLYSFHGLRRFDTAAHTEQLRDGKLPEDEDPYCVRLKVEQARRGEKQWCDRDRFRDFEEKRHAFAELRSSQHEHTQQQAAIPSGDGLFVAVACFTTLALGTVIFGMHCAHAAGILAYEHRRAIASGYNAVHKVTLATLIMCLRTGTLSEWNPEKTPGTVAVPTCTFLVATFVWVLTGGCCLP